MRKYIHTDRPPLDAWQDFAKGLRTVVFCPDPWKAQELEKQFDKAKVITVEKLDGPLGAWHDKQVRVLLITAMAFKLHLISIEAQCVMLLRHTPSIWQYRLMVNVAEPDGLVLDLAGNIMKHGELG